MKKLKRRRLLPVLMLLICFALLAAGCTADHGEVSENTEDFTTEAPVTTEASVTTEAPVTTETPVTTGPVFVEPLITTDASASRDNITVLSIPDTARRNETVSLTIQGAPNTEYMLRVQYSSGWLKDEGLGTKTTDAAGKVTWTWTVGERAPFGTCPIEISGNGQTVWTRFTVVE